MVWVRRLTVAGLVLFAVAGLVLWFAWQPLLDTARLRIEALLAQALRMPVKIGDAGLTLRPLQLSIGDVALGDSGAVLRIHDGRLTVDWRESLRQRQPVADLDAIDVEIAPLGFDVDRPEPAATPRPLPRFLLRRARVRTVRVHLPPPEERFTITASQVDGRVRVGSDGALQILARADDAAITRGDRSVAVNRVHAKIEIQGKDVRIRSARVQGTDLDARMAYDPSRKQHRFRARAELASLQIIDPALQNIVGEMTATGHVSGPFDAATIEGNVRASRIVAFEQEVSDVDTNVRVHEKDLEILSAHARHATGSYRASGNMKLDAEFPFTVDTEWKLANEEVGHRGDTVTNPPLQAFANATARGTLKPLTLRAEAAGQAGRSTSGEEVVTLNANAQFSDGRLQIDATATQKEGNAVTAQIAVGRAGGVDGNVRASVKQVPPLQILLGTPVTPGIRGDLNGELQIHGTTQQPEFAGSLRGKSLELFGASITEVDGSLRGNLQRVDVQGVKVQLARGSITANGTVGLAKNADNSWNLGVTDVPTQTISAVVQAVTGTYVPLWGGQLNVRANGRGPWQAVVVKGTAQLQSFYLQRQPIERVTLTADIAWPRWNATGEVAVGAEEQLTLTANGSGSDALTASLTTNRWDLSRVQSTATRALRGTVQLNASVTGPPAALSGQMRLTGEGMDWSSRPLGPLSLSADGRAGSWTLQAALGDLISGQGTLDTRGDMPLKMALHWNDADLAPVLRPDPNVRIDSTGALDLQMMLGTPQRINGMLRVDRLDVIGAQQAAPLLAAAGPLVVVANAGTFELQSVHLRGTGTKIDANGWFNTGGDCDLTVDAESDLALVEILSPQVHASRGRMVVNGRARQSGGAALQLTGRASLERVAVDLGAPWVAVNVNGQFVFHDTLVEIETLTGRLAGGTFAVEGAMDLARGPQLTWTATELAPSVIPDVEAEVSGTGSVTGTWQDITVAGEIEVLRALYDRRFAITDLIPLFRKQLAKPPPKEAAKTAVHLDLHVSAPDELFVDNNVAKIEMKTDLRITGPADNVAIAGPIEVLNGEVKFRGRTFSLESGVIEFRPELGREAYLNINAQTTVPTARANYIVDTHIVGTTDNFHVTFSSDDPGLSQTDMLSLVTFGKTAAELQEGGGGVSVNDLIALAPGLYQDRAEEQAQRLLGIDRVELEPGYSKSTGLYEPRVTLGKNLTQDLTASLSSTFGVQRRQQVQLEYRVSPRISLLADWESASTNQAGAFGGEIKFHYPFRTFPGWTALLPWPGADVQ